jgi:hypothetical protein
VRCMKTDNNWVWEGQFVVLQKVFLLALETEVHKCTDNLYEYNHFDVLWLSKLLRHSRFLSVCYIDSHSSKYSLV